MEPVAVDEQNKTMPVAQSDTPLDRAPILVTGAHRTGTTWVGKMLTAGGEAAYVSEPLNVLHRPGVLLPPVEHWYTYLCPENEAPYLDGLQDTLGLRYHPLAEMKSLRSRKDVLRMGRDWGIFLRGRLLRQRVLLKDPFAVFSIPWFARRLGCQVVVTVRHPTAFASSLKRLGWRFDFSNLLAQPLLMRDWLEPYRHEMTALQGKPEDVIGQASLLWQMIYQVVAQVQEHLPQLKVVRHEDLSLAPDAGYRELYGALGLRYSSLAKEAISRSTSAENPQEVSRTSVHAVRLDSRANLSNWRRRLSEGEIERIRRQTSHVAALYYPEQEWE